MALHGNIMATAWQPHVNMHGRVHGNSMATAWQQRGKMHGRVHGKRMATAWQLGDGTSWGMAPLAGTNSLHTRSSGAPRKYDTEENPIRGSVVMVMPRQGIQDKESKTRSPRAGVLKQACFCSPVLQNTCVYISVGNSFFVYVICHRLECLISLST